MQIGYRVVERFSSESKDAWAKYVNWSHLVHLTEVVGLDSMLCPSVFGKLIDADWDHLVYGEEIGDCFDDCDYLMRRAAGLFDRKDHQVLAVAREASQDDVQAASLPSFRFMGFDLIDEGTSISALTNCGGFEGAFENSELSSSGLITSASRAYEVREALGRLFPKEPHAECTVWAVWRRGTA